MTEPNLSPGEWVIMKNDQIVEHSKDMGTILELANKYKVEEIIISKEPSAKYCFY